MCPLNQTLYTRSDLFAVILTIIVVMLIAPLVRDTTVASMFKARYGGVWGSQNIFTFAFQIVLILVIGHALAEAPALKSTIVHIRVNLKNQVQGTLLCFALNATLFLLNLELGRVSGALVTGQATKRLVGHISAISSRRRVWAAGVFVCTLPQHIDISW